MMRSYLMPWIPAIFCAVLCLITLVTGIAGAWLTGKSDAGMIAFLCFLPICFFHVGVLIKDLREENRELRSKLDELLNNQ